MKTPIHAAVVVLCAIAGAAVTPLAVAGRITLNDTGMTQCIDHQKNWSSDCTKSQQDAAYGRDVDDADPDDGEAGFSFRKVCRSGDMAGEGNCPPDPVMGSGPDDWGCVYDNITQLTWEAKTAGGGTHDYRLHYTNKGGKARDQPSDAAWLVDTTNTEGLCGANNWRLPDPLELQSIVHYGAGAPGEHGGMIDLTYFPYNLNRNWTRAGYVGNAKWAWYNELTFGGFNLEHRSASYMTARLVHGATRLPRPPLLGPGLLVKDRFIPSADGTEVTDTLTGLVWRRCAEGMGWNDGTQTCDGHAEQFSWTNALHFARDHRQGGWRLPNVKELFSIVDQGMQNPAIDGLAFPNTPSSNFLSSTPVDEPPRLVYVHVVDFGIGQIWHHDAYEYTKGPIRLVRRGRE